MVSYPSGSSVMNSWASAAFAAVLPRVSVGSSCDDVGDGWQTAYVTMVLAMMTLTVPLMMR